MKDITDKQISLRTGEAVGFIKVNKEVFDALYSEKLPASLIFNEAIAAGKLAAKETSRVIPQCHQVPIDALNIKIGLNNKADDFQHLKSGHHLDTCVFIYAEGKSLGRVSIDMEVMMAVSVSALCIFESLKKYDPEIEILATKLISKSGGKADREKFSKRSFKVAILICSDDASGGKKDDAAGKIARELLENHHAHVVDYKKIPEDVKGIQEQVLQWVKEDVHFIFTLGGTGLGKRNLAVDAISEIIERKTPGIIDAMRSYGIKRTPLAMMSRLTAGIIAESLVVTLPGSTAGARESLEAVLPGIFHARKMLTGGKN